jgi:hypothetical protein
LTNQLAFSTIDAMVRKLRVQYSEATVLAKAERKGILAADEAVISCKLSALPAGGPADRCTTKPLRAESRSVAVNPESRQFVLKQDKGALATDFTVIEMILVKKR